MNHKLRRLEEIECSEDNAQEALQVILHTIIFARWPNAVKVPSEVQTACGVSYASCGDPSVARRVQTASAAAVTGTLEEAGPDLLKGALTLTFFERRTSKVAFWAYNEKLVWEEWVLPFLVATHKTPSPRQSVAEKERYAESLRCRVMEVLAQLNEGVDHVPPADGLPTEASHDFEVSCGHRGEQGEPFGARVMAAPAV